MLFVSTIPKQSVGKIYFLYTFDIPLSKKNYFLIYHEIYFFAILFRKRYKSHARHTYMKKKQSERMVSLDKILSQKTRHEAKSYRKQ